MKTKLLWILPLLACSCLDNPADTEQYMKTIYIVGAHNDNRVHEIDINYNPGETETFVSVACGGSLMLDHDVQVDIDIDENGVKEYNDRYHPNNLDSVNMLHQLASGLYRIPDKRAVLRKGGDCYSRITVFIQTEQIHRDSNIVIPLKIVSSSDYTIKKDNSRILLKFNFHNAYSGEYRLEGVRTNLSSNNEEMTTSSIRTLVALNHNTVRLFPGLTLEENARIDDFTLTFRFNDDRTVEVSTYKNLDVTDNGNCSYNPVEKSIKVSYEYTDPDDGNRYRIDGTYYLQ